MAFTEEAWKDLLAKRKKEQGRQREPELRRMEMAAASQERLEGLGDEWRVFLQYVQAMRDTEDGYVKSLQDEWENNLNLDHESLLGLKFSMACSKAARDAYDKVLDTPKRIRETGRAARGQTSEAH